jgi:hypothetical protein
MWIEKLFDLVGKICFPRQQDWQRRRNAKILVAVMAVCAVLGVVLGLVLKTMNHISK